MWDWQKHLLTEGGWTKEKSTTKESTMSFLCSLLTNTNIVNWLFRQTKFDIEASKEVLDVMH